MEGSMCAVKAGDAVPTHAGDTTSGVCSVCDQLALVAMPCGHLPKGSYPTFDPSNGFLVTIPRIRAWLRGSSSRSSADVTMGSDTEDEEEDRAVHDPGELAPLGDLYSRRFHAKALLPGESSKRTEPVLGLDEGELIVAVHCVWRLAPYSDPFQVKIAGRSVRAPTCSMAIAVQRSSGDVFQAYLDVTVDGEPVSVLNTDSIFAAEDVPPGTQLQRKRRISEVADYVTQPQVAPPGDEPDRATTHQPPRKIPRTSSQTSPHVLASATCAVGEPNSETREPECDEATGFLSRQDDRHGGIYLVPTRHVELREYSLHAILQRFRHSGECFGDAEPLREVALGLNVVHSALIGLGNISSETIMCTLGMNFQLSDPMYLSTGRSVRLADLSAFGMVAEDFKPCLHQRDARLRIGCIAKVCKGEIFDIQAPLADVVTMFQENCGNDFFLFALAMEKSASREHEEAAVDFGNQLLGAQNTVVVKDEPMSDATYLAPEMTYGLSSFPEDDLGSEPSAEIISALSRLAPKSKASTAAYAHQIAGKFVRPFPTIDVCGPVTVVASLFCDNVRASDGFLSGSEVFIPNGHTRAEFSELRLNLVSKIRQSVAAAGGIYDSRNLFVVLETGALQSTYGPFELHSSLQQCPPEYRSWRNDHVGTTAAKNKGTVGADNRRGKSGSDSSAAVAASDGSIRFLVRSLLGDLVDLGSSNIESWSTLVEARDVISTQLQPPARPQRFVFWDPVREFPVRQLEENHVMAVDVTGTGSRLMIMDRKALPDDRVLDLWYREQLKHTKSEVLIDAAELAKLLVSAHPPKAGVDRSWLRSALGGYLRAVARRRTGLSRIGFSDLRAFLHFFGKPSRCADNFCLVMGDRFFHGFVSDAESELMLRGAPHGTFIFRFAEGKIRECGVVCTAALRDNTGLITTQHFLLMFEPHRGRFSFDRRVFGSLQEFVKEHLVLEAGIPFEGKPDSYAKNTGAAYLTTINPW